MAKITAKPNNPNKKHTVKHHNVYKKANKFKKLFNISLCINILLIILLLTTKV